MLAPCFMLSRRTSQDLAAAVAATPQFRGDPMNNVGKEWKIHINPNVLCGFLHDLY